MPCPSWVLDRGTCGDCLEAAVLAVVFWLYINDHNDSSIFIILYGFWLLHLFCTVLLPLVPSGFAPSCGLSAMAQFVAGISQLLLLCVIAVEFVIRGCRFSYDCFPVELCLNMSLYPCSDTVIPLVLIRVIPLVLIRVAQLILFALVSPLRVTVAFSWWYVFQIDSWNFLLCLTFYFF